MCVGGGGGDGAEIFPLPSPSLDIVSRHAKGRRRRRNDNCSQIRLLLSPLLSSSLPSFSTSAHHIRMHKPSRFVFTPEEIPMMTFLSPPFSPPSNSRERKFFLKWKKNIFRWGIGRSVHFFFPRQWSFGSVGGGNGHWHLSPPNSAWFLLFLSEGPFCKHGWCCHIPSFMFFKTPLGWWALPLGVAKALSGTHACGTGIYLCIQKQSLKIRTKQSTNKTWTFTTTFCWHRKSHKILFPFLLLSFQVPTTTCISQPGFFPPPPPPSFLRGPTLSPRGPNSSSSSSSSCRS